MPSKTLLVLICTGDKYWQYALPMIESAKRYFIEHDVILFTDCPKKFPVAHQIQVPNIGFPLETLMRYDTMLRKKEILQQYDHIFYADVDMLFVAPVTDDEVLCDGITATQHPGFMYQQPELEKNIRSTAYIASVKKYYCGGFNGGASAEFIKMAESINKNILCDRKYGMVAKWHDESHLNVYLELHPPTKVLSPSFCYPETNLRYYLELWRGQDFEPKLIALDKNKEIIQDQKPSPENYKQMSREQKIATLRGKLRVL